MTEISTKLNKINELIDSAEKYLRSEIWLDVEFENLIWKGTEKINKRIYCEIPGQAFPRPLKQCSAEIRIQSVPKLGRLVAIARETAQDRLKLLESELIKTQDELNAGAE